MCLEENSLKDIWLSLFQSEVCDKVKNLNNEIVAPLMLIERTVIAIQELGRNYVACLEDVKHVKHDFHCATAELKVLREKLNETQKPCDQCISLSQELSFAKKRAKDAESRVTQIAKILVIKSSNDEEENAGETIKCPSISPKRKRSCLRNKVQTEEEGISSQTVEVGKMVSPTLSVAELRLSSQDSSISSSPSRRLKSLRLSPTKASTEKLLTRNSQKISPEKLYSPKRNLTTEFDAIESPKMHIRLNSDDKIMKKRANDDSIIISGHDNDSFTEYAKKCGAELDNLWFSNDNTSRKIESEGNKKSSFIDNQDVELTNCEINSQSDSCKNGTKYSEAWKSKPLKIKLNARSNKFILNSDNSYDIVFEKKKPKKKFKQLTLQMKPWNKNTEESLDEESDVEDIVLPSPDKMQETNDLDELFEPGATSTQRPVSIPSANVLDKKLLTSPFKRRGPIASTSHQALQSRSDGDIDKKKSSSPTKRRGPASSTSNQALDNSFDVILDQRKTPSPNYKYKGKTVRGKARTKLQGWDCEDCQKFYEIACKNLSPSKVKAKMNLCSRHRSKHKQARPPTPPGFWDIDIPDTPE